MDCIFCKIAQKEIPKEFIYEDEEVMVFPDIHPVKPVHMLVVPKKHVKEFLHLHDDVLLAKLKKVIHGVVKNQGLEDKGYKIILNGGGNQEVDHLHIHVIGPMNKE